MPVNARPQQSRSVLRPPSQATTQSAAIVSVVPSSRATVTVAWVGCCARPVTRLRQCTSAPSDTAARWAISSTWNCWRLSMGAWRSVGSPGIRNCSTSRSRK